MARLAAYIAELAKLLGETEHVHFDALEESSIRAVVRIDEPAAPKIRERLAGVRAGDAPEDAMRAAAKLNRMLAEDNAAVPFRVLDVLAIFLIGGLGCQRESGEAAVVVGANFCVAAKESDEGDFVLVHGGDLRFVEFPVSCSGHPSRKRASGPCSQGRSSAFTEGPSKMETVTRRAAQPKQKSEPAAGRRKGPEA